MESVQFIQVTPEQLQSAIIEGVKTQLDDLKKYFTPVTPTEYLSKKEVASILGVNISTVNNWSKNKLIQPYQLGGRIFFKRENINNAMLKLNS